MKTHSPASLLLVGLSGAALHVTAALLLLAFLGSARPAFAQGGGTPGTADIDGSWKINANNHSGEMTLKSSAAGQFSGTVLGNPLVSGALRGNTMTFRRQYTGGHQDYTGTVSVAPDGTVSVAGTFTQDGQGSYRWSATRGAKAPPPSPTPPPTPTPGGIAPPGTVDIAGLWQISANGFPGEMTLEPGAPGQFTGTFHWPLVNGTLRGTTMTFRRQYPGGYQDYTGTVSVAPDGTVSVKGTFSQDGRGSYGWSATKTKKGPPPTPIPAPSPTPSPAPTPSPKPSPPPPTPTPTPAPADGMILRADRRQVKAGETVLLPVSLINAKDVANMNFTVSYDAGVAVSAGPIVRGNLLGNALFEQNPTERGLMRVGYAQSGGISGTGPVAAIPFKAVGKPGDRTSVRLAVTTINNSAGSRMQIARVDGEILIVGAGGELPLDCDGDAAITAADARCALQMSVNLRPVNLVMDADADRQVTSNDARLILQKAVGR